MASRGVGAAIVAGSASSMDSNLVSPGKLGFVIVDDCMTRFKATSKPKQAEAMSCLVEERDIPGPAKARPSYGLTSSASSTVHGFNLDTSTGKLGFVFVLSVDGLRVIVKLLKRLVGERDIPGPAKARPGSHHLFISLVSQVSRGMTSLEPSRIILLSHLALTTLSS